MNLTWYLIRGSGLAAFALLSASVIWGLMISSKVFGRAVKAKGLQWIHESFSLAAVVATAVHLVTLSLDEFIDFAWVDILVPGASEWEPVSVALGIAAFWTMAIVTISFYLKRWIGQSRWRAIHYLSFGSFIAALAHGVAAGTDTANPWVAGMYIGAGLVALTLTALRIVTSFSDQRGPRPNPVAHTANEHDAAPAIGNGVPPRIRS